ncbi:hypothetical protein E1A91_A01G076600v1 [Gossypium mustelinum]|uniref:Uncharacterized protein n=1 Tax=Gossypium mustelinum TaxID=34275 RepID=A0A5D3AGI6_GOSMU|nr:hypothetical protein E1A91_A01G076600v1 [Gossypium mustelinum]
MNPNSTMFDPRTYPYMRFRLSSASIQVLQMQSCTGKRPWRLCVGTTRGSPILLLLSCIPEISGLGSMGLPRMATREGYCCSAGQSTGVFRLGLFRARLLVSNLGPKIL